jgi:hypothetical protein
MRVIGRVLAVLLLTVWLPVTLHCDLEAAGLIDTVCATDCGQQDGANDRCDIVERGLYKSSADFVKIPAPELLHCVFAFVPSLELEAHATSLFLPEFVSEPQTLRRTWQFVQRAAPPSRAPSLIV